MFWVQLVLNKLSDCSEGNLPGDVWFNHHHVFWQWKTHLVWSFNMVAPTHCRQMLATRDQNIVILPIHFYPLVFGGLVVQPCSRNWALAGLDNPLQVMCCRAPRKLMLGATWPWSRALPSCCVPTCRGPALHDGCGWWSREVAICGSGSFRSGWGVWLVQNKDTHETPVLSEKISS